VKKTVRVGLWGAICPWRRLLESNPNRIRQAVMARVVRVFMDQGSLDGMGMEARMVSQGPE